MSQATSDEPRLHSITLRLTGIELSAAGRAAFVITSPGEPGFINAADRAHRRLWEAARKHPEARP